MAVNQAAMRRRARIMRAVNVPMRAALNLADGRRPGSGCAAATRPPGRNRLPIPPSSSGCSA